MANIIKPKRSNTAGVVPTTSNLSSGELGVNMADQKSYINNGTAVVQIGAGKLSGLGDVAITTPVNGQSLSYNGTNWVNSSAGAGDVVGSSSSTDNALVRFDGTTGKLIQNGVVTEDDNGNMSGILSQTFADGTAVTVGAGKQWYNGTTGSWNLGMGGGNITQQVGEELFVYGKASSAITDSPLQIVYKTGTVGASGTITFAPTTSGITDGDLIIGIATESLALNAFGRITTFGVVHGITTNGTAYGETWANNDTIWYNPVTGNPTNVKPTAPNIKVQVGTVINAGNGGSGSFQVEINHGSVLGGTDSNVQLNGVTGGQLLSYDQTNAYWKNINLTDGTGINITETTGGAITIANTGILSISGTAPIGASTVSGATTISITQATTTTNGYLSSTDWNTFNGKQATLVSGTNIKTVGGTTLLGSGDVSVGVTSVSGTAPISSSGGATPAISISQASSTTNGYLSSTDWNTFNNKSNTNGTVTSVSGTAPISVATGTTTPAISISQANSTTNGYLSSTDWNTFNNKGSGSVTSITAGTGLSGGTITTSGTVALANTAVTAGSYTYASITVDAQGRLTSASSGSAPSSFPSGTVMLFRQTSAPTGWTKDVTNYNDSAIRVVTGAVSSGGTVGFTTAFASQTPSGSVSTTVNNTTATGTLSVTVSAGTLAVGIGTLANSATTLSTTQIPSHSHTYSTTSGACGGGSYTGITSAVTSVNTGNTGGGGSHTHSLSGSPSISGSPSVTGQTFTGTAHNHTASSSFSGNAINMAVKYCDVIFATKD